MLVELNRIAGYFSASTTYSFIQLHAVSRIFQVVVGRQNNLVLRHSVLHFLSNFWVIACWRAKPSTTLLPWYQSEEIKTLINNNSFPLVEIELTTDLLQSHVCALTPRWRVFICKLHIQLYLINDAAATWWSTFIKLSLCVKWNVLNDWR